MKRFLLLLVLALSTVVRAQDESEAEPPAWINVSKISFIANKGTDKLNAPIKYLMITEQAMKDNEELFEQVHVLLDEISQEELNQGVPESIKALEEQIVELRKLGKENPDIKPTVVLYRITIFA